MPPQRNNMMNIVAMQHQIMMNFRYMVDFYDDMMYQQLYGRQRRRWWTKRWLLRRPILGFSATLVQELEREDPVLYESLLGVSVPIFDDLLRRVGPHLQLQDTNMRSCIPSRTRLQVGLRYMKTGSTYQDIAFEFRIGRCTVGKIVSSACQAIVNEYYDELVKCPTTALEWKRIAHNWETETNLPHCLGALDGTHIPIKCPAREPGGLSYWNYKGFYSIAVLALCDANFKILWCQVGANGAASDAQLFEDCDLRRAAERGLLHVPHSEPLLNETYMLPYFFIADDAFALKSWLMKPFSRHGASVPNKCFNYRLSRARIRIECTFGILKARFACLKRGMSQSVDNITVIVQACIVLHNLTRVLNPRVHTQLMDYYDDEGVLQPGPWRNEVDLADAGRPPLGYRGTNKGHEVREYLKLYLSSQRRGATDWQWEHVFPRERFLY